MKKIHIIFSLLFVLLLVNCEESPENVRMHKIQYPSAPKANVRDTFFGQIVEDPYRWMENEQDSNLKKWLDEQVQITDSFFKTITYRDTFKNIVESLIKQPTVSLPWQAGKYLFYFRSEPEWKQYALFAKKPTGQEIEIFDPNKINPEGTTFINGIGINDDATIIAIELSDAGSDWGRVIFKNIKTGKFYGDTLKRIKFSSFSFDNQNGVYYSAYPEPPKGKEFSQINFNHTIYYHKIGTDQSEDKPVFKSKNNPLHSVNAEVSPDFQYLIVYESQGTGGNDVFVKKMNSDEWVRLFGHFNNENAVIDIVQDTVWILTDENAPNKKIIKVPLGNPKNKVDWIAEDPQKVIRGVNRSKNYLWIYYLENIESRLYKLSLNNKGNIEEVKLPFPGIISNFNSYHKNDSVFLSISTYISKPIQYLWTPGKGFTIWYQPENNFKTDDIKTEPVFYYSKDGAKVPMTIIYPKNIKLDGQNPCLLYGYGGFNISILPSFNPMFAAWLQMGGIVAVANLRGGNEFGEKWHKEGMLLNKQNVFNDFIAAAEYLIKKKYTSKEHLAIHGRSNGGLLIGAVMTQRPDLAKVALPMVGVLDMLRFHKFTIGHAWMVEYGNPEDSVHFFNLLRYSPYHNVKPAKYPATLVITSDHDDRVVPAHSYKFLARLQENQEGDLPILLRLERQAGHGAGKSKDQMIDEIADILSFAWVFCK